MTKRKEKIMPSIRQEKMRVLENTSFKASKMVKI